MPTELPSDLDVAWPRLELGDPIDGGYRSDVRWGRLGGRDVVVRRSARPSDALVWELDLLVDLDRRGVRVPAPIRASDGALHHDGVVVQPFVDGRAPEGADDWARVAVMVRRLHQLTIGARQRPGFASAAELQRSTRGGDVDLDAMPPDVVDEVRACWRRVAVGPSCVVHGDLGAANVVIGADGRATLLDWDEARVDVPWFDLGDLPLDLPVGGPSAAHVRAASLAWEVATCWVAEPEYARTRWADLRALAVG